MTSTMQALGPRSVNRLIREESGATAVEYGLMIAAIAATIMLVVISVGSQIDSAYMFVNTALDALTP